MTGYWEEIWGSGWRILESCEDWAEDMGGFWESWRGDRGDLIGWMVEGDGDLSLFRVVLVMSVLTTVEESASDCLWTWNEFCDEACSEAD